MAEAIRWDTIMSRPNTEAIQGINSAGALLNNGFSQLQGVLKQNEAVQQNNFDNHTKLNTAAFQDAVAKYRSPEELKAAMDSGALDQLRASLGPNIDNNAIRGAADQRMLGLMQQKQQEVAFNHIMTDERVAPLVDRYKTASLKGDRLGAAAAEAEYTKLGGRDLAGLTNFADQRANELNERDMKKGKYDMDIRQSNASITHMQNADKNDSARLGLDQQRLGMQREEHLMTLEDRLGQRLQKTREEMGALSSTTASSAEGTKALYGALATLKDDPEAYESARLIIPRLVKEPGMTTGAAISAILGIDTNWALNSSARNDAVKGASELSKGPEALALRKNVEDRRAQVADEQLKIRSKQDKVTQMLDSLYRPNGKK